MNRDEKVEIVQAMQDYIKEHVEDVDFELGSMYEVIGYSKRHADRLFAELLHMTPKEYGYEYDFDAAPKYNYGASREMGAKLAFPVKRISDVK